MKPRSEAINILQQARDLLAERLTERIREAREQILEDAEGNSYLSEIEQIYEQLGGRLAHLNAMLSNLPPAEEPQAAETTTTHTASPVFTDVAAATFPSTIDATPPFPVDEPLALPAPDQRTVTLAAPATFQGFALQIHASDLEAAGRSLAELFAVDAARGRRCAEVFSAQLAVNPDLFGKAMKLRADLESGNVNGALMLLWECFGLQGLESLGVLQTLKMRFGIAGDAHAA
jgi:hypothetical protein